MALPTSVNPGDLIRAELMNEILQALGTLDDRVSTLEATSSASTGLVITSIIPSGPVRVAEEMQILGQNFGFGIGAHRVFIDGVRVLNFKSGSSDQKLVYDIPPVSNIPPEGKAVVLSVSNQTASETRTVHLLPQLIALGGNVDVNFAGVTPATITAEAQATFRYRVFSRANQSGQFQITATISGVPNVTDWQNAVRVLNDDNSENTARTISLQPQEERFFRVRINAVPATPSNATFTLAAGVSAGGVQATPDSRQFTVGQQTETPDDTMTLSFQTSLPITAFNNGTLRVPRGGAAQITLLGDFTATGAFTLSPVITTGTGWTIEIPGSATPPPHTRTFNVTEDDLENLPHQRTFSFVVRASASASATGRAEVRLQRTGGGRQLFPINLTV